MKVTFPELSSVDDESFITFHVVLSNRARALSVEEAGQVTSPLHEAKATLSTYPFVATCVELEGVGTIGLEENVLIPATVSSSVLCTTAVLSAFHDIAEDIYVVVAVETGSSAKVQSLREFQSEISANMTTSSLAGVHAVTQVGKIISDMVYSLRDSSSIPARSWLCSSAPLCEWKRSSRYNHDYSIS